MRPLRNHGMRRGDGSERRVRLSGLLGSRGGHRENRFEICPCGVGVSFSFPGIRGIAAACGLQPENIRNLRFRGGLSMERVRCWNTCLKV